MKISVQTLEMCVRWLNHHSDDHLTCISLLMINKDLFYFTFHSFGTFFFFTCEFWKFSPIWSSNSLVGVLQYARFQDLRDGCQCFRNT